MDIIQELENLKSKIAGKASTTITFASYPPQHPFAAGISVESVISDVDVIIAKLTSIKEGKGGKSAAARRLRYIVDQGDFSSDQISLLLEVANLMDNEFDKPIPTTDQSHQYFVYPVVKSDDLNIKSFIAFIKGYVETGGPCTASFITQVYNFIDHLDSTIYNNKMNIKVLTEELTKAQSQERNIFANNILKRIRNHG